MPKITVTANYTTKTKMLIRHIKERREHLQYKQAHVAQRLSMSVNAYSKIERGLTHLDLPKLFKLAEILELDVKAMV